MAVAFRAATNTVATAASSTPAEPTGTQPGDLMMVVYVVATAGAPPVLPAGWTALFGGAVVLTSAQVIVGWAPRGPSAPSYAFTHTGSVYHERCLMALSGADLVSPISASGSVTQGAVASNNPNPPSVTLGPNAMNGGLGVAAGVNFSGSAGGTPWALTGYAMRSRNTATDDMPVATKTGALTNPEDPPAMTGAATGSVQAWAATIAINPAPVRRHRFDAGVQRAAVM